MNEGMLNSNDAMLFCDKMDLINCNQIQPYGALIVLNKNKSVIYYSENITSFFGVTEEELLSQPISHFLKPSNPDEDLLAYLNSANKKYNQMLLLSKEKATQILVYINQVAGNIVLEIEKSDDSQMDDFGLINSTQFAIESMKNIMSCNTVAKIAQQICEKIKKLTSYNRVIIYKFEKTDHSGVVIGEVVDKGVDSYIGLHFPANDIPKNVRSMYLNQYLRYMPSCQQLPIKVISTIHATTSDSLDLSYINLRMIAPVHVQYLQNMKVSSAVSVAIIQNNRLWGLIACHHLQEKFLTLNQRLSLLLIANAISAQAWILESKLDSKDEQKIVALQSKLTSSFKNEDSIVYGIDTYHDVMMKLVSATGMSHFYQGILLNYGNTPKNKQIMDLIAWLNTKTFQICYNTSRLPEKYPDSFNYKDKACGLLAIKITTLEDHYLLFYKPEKLLTIQWAGNPAEVLRCTGTSYTPRDSFEIFLQTIDNLSTPWTKSNINSANIIHSIISNKQLQDLLQAQIIHDPLTNLLNRTYLEQRISTEIKRASRSKTHLSIIMADLDYFKNINDKYGHQAGDAVLIGFAQLLIHSFREYDSIYRYGGEEFLIILPNTELKAAYEKAESFRDKAKKNKIKYNDNEIYISVSMGVSVYPEHGDDAKSIIAEADAALYKAKQNGRDQVSLASVK